MRKINTRRFRVATRATAREVNRQIVLNLIREHQPISRAELARRMNVRRAALTAIVRGLIGQDEVVETGPAASARGRRPVLLRIQTSNRLAIAVDIRASQTTLLLADFGGAPREREVFVTPKEPAGLVSEVAIRTRGILERHSTGNGEQIHGVGVVVPGMVDKRSGRVLYAPRLGWRDLDLRAALTKELGLPVFIENTAIACALARLWSVSSDSRAVNNFAYVSVSDGVGVGVVIHGEVLRGEAHTAGEFGHVSLDPFGPQCACGKRGCWEAFACNSATSKRYVAEVGGPKRGGGGKNGSRRSPLLPVEEIVRRAKRGERAAEIALEGAAWEIGRGLAAVVSTLNPKRIYLGGEITAAWELIEKPMREALTKGTLTSATRETPIIPDRSPGEYRVLGAVALVATPKYAAPQIG